MWANFGPLWYTMAVSHYGNRSIFTSSFYLQRKMLVLQAPYFICRQSGCWYQFGGVVTDIRFREHFIA